MATEPDDADDRHVQHQHHQREQQDEELPHALADAGDVAVGVLEALGLSLLAHEGADDPDAGELLTHHPVDGVELVLVGAEQGQHPAHDEAHRHEQDRHRHPDQPRQARGARDRHDDAAHRHERRRHQHRGTHHHQHLDLLDVVGVAGDERARPEGGDLPLGEAADPLEDLAAQVPAHAHRRARSEVGRQHRAHALGQAHPQHERAHSPDITGVPGGHTLVDDVGIESGQVQGGHHFSELKHQNAHQQPRVGAQVRAQ